MEAFISGPTGQVLGLKILSTLTNGDDGHPTTDFSKVSLNNILLELFLSYKVKMKEAEVEMHPFSCGKLGRAQPSCQSITLDCVIHKDGPAVFTHSPSSGSGVMSPALSVSETRRQ